MHSWALAQNGPSESELQSATIQIHNRVLILIFSPSPSGTSKNPTWTIPSCSFRTSSAQGCGPFTSEAAPLLVRKPPEISVEVGARRRRSLTPSHV